MDRYYLDERVVTPLKAALDEDIEAGLYTGEFSYLAKSVSRKIGETTSPVLSSEEYNFLRHYVSDLLVTESRSGPYKRQEFSDEGLAPDQSRLQTGEASEES